MGKMLVPGWIRLDYNRRNNSARRGCRRRSNTMRMASFLLFLAIAGAGHAQSNAVVCRDGTGSFEATFPTGVSVQVGAARREGLARRECEGALLWDRGKLDVASGAAQVDLDAFGIDLGAGSPVAIFQAKQTNAECCMTLQIYSLRKPPKLLRTITGGSFFSSADTDLDGQIEIWTNDAASLQGFESPGEGTPDIAPTIVLRFERGRLLDVSSEFQRYYDNQIARLRSGLDAEELRDFKNSSGRLAPTAHFSVEEVRRSDNLERTKEKVLQIVRAFLYSGREQEAWNTLAEFWPAADAERIRAAIVRARAQGIRAQMDGTSTKTSAGAEKRTEIFDARTLRSAQPGMKLSEAAAENSRSGIVRPMPILIGRQVSDEQEETLADSGLLLDLVIDSAGKVRSAESADPAFDSSLKSATVRWKFIPMLRSGRAIASRVLFIISPKR
jgi:hypothetical protein